MNEDRLCCWCEKQIPKKRVNNFCSESCEKDAAINAWPSWMTGRVGPAPSQDWHMTGDYLCLSAPNRFRALFRKRLPVEESQAAIIALQEIEWPSLSGASGLDLDFPSWDQILIWRGASLEDARRVVQKNNEGAR